MMAKPSDYENDTDDDNAHINGSYSAAVVVPDVGAARSHKTVVH